MNHYISKPSYDKHPDRMCLIARLFGVHATLLNDGARVLEIGCGTGSDLIPVALGSPQCEFVGVDSSEEMINSANATVTHLGLTNVRFIRQDIAQLPHSGNFDYIIVHGVLSWVKTDVQENIFKFCGENLTDNGVCYISCNMLPGCEVRDFLREEFKKVIGSSSDKQQPAELRKFLRGFIDDKSERHLPFQLARLRAEAQNMLTQSEEYLLYEMCSESKAFFFQDLARVAKSFGLKYLGDSKLKRVGFLDVLDFQDHIETGDEFVACCEQEADLSRMEMFRANLFCKNSTHIERKPDLSVIEKCYISTVLTYNEDNFGESFFFNPSGKRVEIKSPEVTQILKVLAQNWPRPVHYEALKETHAEFFLNQKLTSDINSELFELFKKEFLDFYLLTPQQSATMAVSPYARFQLQTQNWATNYRHEYVNFTDDEIKVAKLLDGNNSLQDIFDKLDHAVRLDKIEDIVLFLRESAFMLS